jgi:hypothetical protein
MAKERTVILPRLRRVRWAVRATLVLGVAASVVANILHALDNPISQAIAAWPPLALLLTVELISRVPVHHRSLAAARFLATATIAGIAAWVSYWHMVGVAARYGETGASPYLLPLSVDGLIVVASICLVELGGRISSLEREAEEKAAATPAPVVTDGALPGLIPLPAPQLANADRPAVGAQRTERPAAGAPGTERPAAGAPRTERPKIGLPKTRGAEASSFSPTMTREPRPAKPSGGNATNGRTGAKARRTPAETLAEAAKIKASRPGVTETQLAAELGISASRWRAIRRETAVGDDLRLVA